MKKAFAAMFAFLSLLGCAQSPVREGGYAVDAAWPKPLPNNWTLGQVAGIAVDARDHVWLIHRPKTLIDEEKGAALSPPRAKCCVAAPPVIEFDGEGNLLRAWGGPGAGYEWFENEHGIYVDTQGNVWVGGNDPKDHQLIKFTPDGKFLMQIGRAGQTGGSNSPTLLGRPAHMEIDAAANELYIADGYGNKRVIVLDASTGAYKRHWGAYGRAPSDEKLPLYNPQSPQFANPVHCVRLSNDGLVYVCDRQQPRAGVQEGRNFRQAVHVRGEIARLGLVLRPGVLERRAAEIFLPRRRHQRPGAHGRARVGQSALLVRPARPLRRAVPGAAQHRHRFEGQPLHVRGRQRQARAEIQAGELITLTPVSLRKRKRQHR